MKQNLLGHFLILAFFTAMVRPAHAAPVDGTLSLSHARAAAIAAERHAEHLSTQIVVTIVDGGGHILLTERMPGAQLASLELAHRKAISAVYYKRPSKAFEDALAGGKMAVLALPDAMPAGGGLPIVQGGIVIGAIGVSGGNNAQDQESAQAGLDALSIGDKTQ
ncbi:GlcG/HbpS family heme-binding protein [Neoasaia chiangmaiensis]|nr:heme-binding protein [Neoasaia chiangmaiensis]